MSNFSKLFLAAFDPEPDETGGHPYRGPADIPEDLDWASLDRLCPIPSFPEEYAAVFTPEWTAEDRLALKQGVALPFFEQPSIERGELIEHVLGHLHPDVLSGTAGRLYVLGFQGFVQYVMFGRTQNVQRRVAAHRRDAGRHGFGLLNAWISPTLPNANPQERLALDLARKLQNTRHQNECFYQMPFDKTVTIARVAAEAAILALVQEDAAAYEGQGVEPSRSRWAESC